MAKTRLALGVLVAALGLVYTPVLIELVKDWIRDPNYSHGFLMPVISGYLVWARRKELQALPVKPVALGLAGVIGSCAMLVLGAAGAEVFTQRVSLVLMMASLVLFFGGWAWLRATAFPIAFLLLAIPMPYVIYYGLTQPLQGLAAVVAVEGLQLLGVLAVRQGNVIHLPGTSLEVAEACSGIRSLYAFLALGALIARSTPLPWWGKWLVFFSTIPLSVVSNSFRVLGTGIGAHVIGPEVAHGTIHESFGMVCFAGGLILFFVITKGARWLWSPESPSVSSS